jgi:hypothetical protein
MVPVARLASVCAVALSGCVAANPDRIAPMSISTVGYETLDCARLAQEDHRVASELGPLIYYQRQRRTTDAAGIILIGLSPTGLGSPEHGAAIARLKGERETIAKVKTTKACSQPQAVVNDRQPAAVTAPPPPPDDPNTLRPRA